MAPGIKHNKPSHTTGAGRRKQAVDKISGLPGPAGNRKHQKERTCQDHCKEAPDNKLGLGHIKLTPDGLWNLKK